MNTDENLKRQLSAWNVEIEVPPRFQSEVWAKIAAREKTQHAWWESLRDIFATAFAQPQMAGAVVALGLALSVGTAFFKAQDSNALMGRELESRYVATINPLAHVSSL